MERSDPIYRKLTAFASKHQVVLVDQGRIGFGRPCVGFIKGSKYIAINPVNESTHDRIASFFDERLAAPPGVVDAYQPQGCLCVLAHDSVPGNDDGPFSADFDTALTQLAIWVDHLEEIGVEVEPYDTGATGLKVLVGGNISYALKVKTHLHEQAVAS